MSDAMNENKNFLQKIEFGLPLWLWLCGFFLSYLDAATGDWFWATAYVPVFIFCVLEGKRNK